MADHDPNRPAMYVLDGSSVPATQPMFNDAATVATSPGNAPSSLSLPNVPGNGQSFYPSSNWGFHGTPPYEPYDTTAAPSSTGALFQTASPWDLSPQRQSHLSEPGSGNVLHQSGPSPASTTSAYADPISQQINGPGSSHSTASSLPAGVLTSLTPAQQEKLRNIAMPPHLQYHSPRSEPSPVSSTGDHKAAAASSPEPADGTKGLSRKRKSSADVEDDDDEDDDGQQPVKKTAHNMIEKRYRTNLNDKIAALRDSVPALRIMSKSARGEDTTEDREELHGLTPAHKLNKATVLSKATEYIRHLEKRNTRLVDENQAMQARIAAFEKLFMAGAMNGAMTMPNPPTPVQYPSDGQSFMATPMATPRTGTENPAGMIPVPDDMKRIISAQLAAGQPYPVPNQQYPTNPSIIRQQQIQQQQQMQRNRWGNTAPYLGKLMVGSLAGLMILEAVRENEMSSEKPEGRGLFAMPMNLLSYLASNLHVTIMGQYYSSAQVLLTLKLVVLCGSLLWVFVPSLFATKEPKPQKKVATQEVGTPLEAAPSLAAPIQVRRDAWLTAIQTVWVPEHNFLLEAAALLLKTMKLSLRNMMGTHGYQMLTGLTEEQEAARVKAWSIALDAQLTGGDVEINKSRLTLTLLASGTLPDTPLRLMLKALHIRVLLWNLGRDGLQLDVAGVVARKLARAKWNEARQLQRMLTQLRRSATSAAASDQTNTGTTGTDGDDDIPDHLAALLEQECDEVLDDEVVRRAHNLAWNLATRHHVAGFVDGMDGVVADPAIRSPLDAVAAWWSCVVLHRALGASLATRPGDAEARKTIASDVDLALRVAPIGSDAQVRALLALAVLVDEGRADNLRIAAQAVDPSRQAPALACASKLGEVGVSASAAEMGERRVLRCAAAVAYLRAVADGSAVASVGGRRLVESVVVPLSAAASGKGTSSSSSSSLLECAAVYRVVQELFAEPGVVEGFAGVLERLAGGLRVWVGGAAGAKLGLGDGVRELVVERCVAITKCVVGMDDDMGYWSMSD